MHNIIFIELFECLQELPKDDECLGLGEHLLFLEETFQCASVTVLIDEVEVVGSF